MNKRKNHDLLHAPKRATVERDLMRKHKESEHFGQELKVLRPKLVVLQLELKELYLAKGSLEQATEDLRVGLDAAISERDRCLDDLAMLRDALEDTDVRLSSARSRLEALEAAGKDLLEFLPTEATGRARFSKHAKAAVAFRKALEGK